MFSIFSAIIIFISVVNPFASIFHFEGSPPQSLGVYEGHLRACPDSPNCVVSYDESDDSHYIEPIKYDTDLDTAKNTLTKVLSVVPNTTIIEEKDNYIRTEFRSKLMGFVDDGEFYFPKDKSIIEVRSASRLGESDLGVNRRRLEQIRLAIQDYNNSI